MTISDLKYAARLLMKSPWFTLLTVLVLTGGLGISIYTFAALDTMIYGDLPLPQGGSIVRVGEGGWPNVESLDAFELARIRGQAESVRELGAYRRSRSLVGGADGYRSLRSTEADWHIFEFTRTPPRLGRGFVRDDAAPSAEPVAVLGYQTWQSVFAGAPDIVGEVVRVNGRPTRIVGVMPEKYAFPFNTQMWLPLSRQDLEPSAYTGRTFDAYARLRPGVSARAAETELTALLQSLRRQRPEADGRDLEGVAILTFQEEQWGVLGTVVFSVLNLLALSILLLAAVNVGNLLLARTNARIKEIGVRVALGAPRLRLTLQTMLENVILCAVGGLLAIALASRALDATDGFMHALLGDGELPFWWTWSLDRDVVLAAASFLLLTVVLVSVLPASVVGRADPNALLKDDARGGGGGRGTGRISRALVTVQVALISAVMVVGSAATVIAERAAHFDFGLDTSDLFMMGVRLPADRYDTAETRLSFSQRLLTELRATPGVDAAAVMAQAGVARFALEGREYDRPEDQPGAWLLVLSETPTPVGPTLIEGRGFDGRDSATGLKTAIVSESLAQTRWPNESPLGRRIEVSIGDRPAQQRIVVGVVADVRYDPVGMIPIGLSAIYLPLPQYVPPAPGLVVRYPGDEARARSAMYAALGRVDPAIGADIRTYASALGAITLFARTVTKLFAGCGAFAILLAISGIYGMSSNAVLLRTHEIGLRRALGASNRDVVTIFIAQGARQLAVGLAFSALLSAVVLILVRQGFSIGAGALVLIGSTVVLVVSASVLLSIYLSVRGVIRREPSAALRYA